MYLNQAVIKSDRGANHKCLTSPNLNMLNKGKALLMLKLTKSTNINKINK